MGESQLIVKAQSYHLKELVKIGQRYYEESPYSRTHSFDSNTLLNWLRRAMVLATYEVAVVEYDGQVIGGAVAYLADYAWCNEVRVNMEFIYVDPEHRADGHSEALIDHMVSWARACQAREITAGDIGLRPRLTEGWLENQGFSDTGVMLRKVL